MEGGWEGLGIEGVGMVRMDGVGGSWVGADRTVRWCVVRRIGGGWGCAVVKARVEAKLPSSQARLASMPIRSDLESRFRFARPLLQAVSIHALI